MVIPFILTSPTDDDHAVSLVFTQRFSVGHFWSPHQTTTESIFYKLSITINNSIGYKPPHYHAVSPIWTSKDHNYRTSAPGTQKHKTLTFRNLCFFYTNSPLLGFTDRHFVRKMPSFTDGHLNFHISSVIVTILRTGDKLVLNPKFHIFTNFIFTP